MIKEQQVIDVFDDVSSLLEISDILVKVSGTSMWPFFKDNKTKVKLTKIKEIKKGKIYLFKKENTYVIHRLVKVKGEELTFRGDGNFLVERVSKDNLIAELIAFTNNGKKEIKVTNKFYRFKVFIYRLMPRRVVIKLFKRKNDK